MKEQITLSHLIFKGPSWRNCGAGTGQEDNLKAEAAFQKTITGEYAQTFGQNEALFNNLNTNLSQITSAGLSQQGYTPAQLAAINAQNVNDAAASNQKLQTAIGENAAGKSNATPGIESGIEQAERAAAATQVENTKNTNAAKITQQNYETGRQNYWTATEASEKLPQAIEGATSDSAGEVTGANNAVGTQANANATANNAWLGIVGGVAGDAATAFGSYEGASKCWIAATVYDGWDDARVDLVRNYLFNVWAKESRIGRFVTNLYAKFGRSIALFITNKPMMKKIFKALFDNALQKARRRGESHG